MATNPARYSWSEPIGATWARYGFRAARPGARPRPGRAVDSTGAQAAESERPPTPVR